MHSVCDEDGREILHAHRILERLQQKFKGEEIVKKQAKKILSFLVMGRCITPNELITPTVMYDVCGFLCDFQKIKNKPKSCFHTCGKRHGRMVLTSKKVDEALSGYTDAHGEYDKGLNCGICLRPAFNGLMARNCAHHFHLGCLSKALAQDARCPECRIPMGRSDFHKIEDVPEARFLRQSLAALMVQCPAGCEALVKWESQECHVREECPEVEVYCKYGACKGKAQVSEIDDHERTCGEATVDCVCGNSIIRKDMEQHSQTCPAQPISCRFCKQQGIRRDSMNSHFQACNGSVPMSEIWKLMCRVNELEAQVESSKRRRTQ
eukprot:TRINITY_DN61254_c0_g1_i1.p1 TRINITY_DN61254_c0_g1~~TRINITY_DN61254_c0_g1_i1.p1  ORF type:complete len:322 (+),score=45.66 TRINITY_DN61254_c0_g1_i1:53-1018(+)